MSGGSYDYLFSRDSSEPGVLYMESTLEEMAARLAGLGYAEDAAHETEEVLLIIRQMKVRIDTRCARLREVWRAVEWWDSGDSGEDGVHRALAAYRGDED